MSQDKTQDSSEDAVVFDFEIDMDRVFKAMDTPDDIGSVLRVHLEVERVLDHVIGRILPKPEKAGWRYPNQKIGFLLAFGIPELRLKPAQIINTIRNNVVHRERKESIEEINVAQLFDALNAVTGGRMTKEFEFIRRVKSTGVEISKTKYKDMSTREKFCLLGIAAVGTIAVLVNELNLPRPSASPI